MPNTHTDEGPVEAVAFRLAAHGLTENPVLSALAPGGETPEPAGTRAIIFNQGVLDTPVYRRDALTRGTTLSGPAAIEEDGAATLVPPSFSVECHASGALILTRDGLP